MPEGVIFIWAGTNASIPSGWSRETSLDGKYIKGTASGVDPDVTGGSNTHTHTSPAHTHSLNSHSHSYNTGTDSATNTEDASDDRSGGVKQSHSHGTTMQSTSGGSLSDAISYQSVNQEPPYYEVIFITPTSGYAPFHDDVIGLWKTASEPDGFSFCDGTDGTPNLRNRYLKGASGGANAGSTGGSLTHTHVVDHSHTAQGHTHVLVTNSVNEVTLGGGGGSLPTHSHTHTVALASTSLSAGSYTGNVTSGTVEPQYKKIVPIQNTSGNPKMTVGIIGMWLGLLDDIPVGWVLCDGTQGTENMLEYYAKMANTLGEVTSTGGNNNHTHAASNSHTHTATGTHTHTAGTSSTTSDLGYGTNSGPQWASIASHTHGVGGSVGSATAVWANATIQANSANNEPAYRTVAFIQYKFSADAALMAAII